MGTPPLYVVYAPARRRNVIGRLVGFVTLAVVVTATLVAVVSLLGSSGTADSASHGPAPTKPVSTPQVKPGHPAIHKRWVRPPSQTPVMVLNANGVKGAATGLAARLRRFGYPTPVIADSGARTLSTTIQYRPGYRRAAKALAHRLGGGTVVEPLDGIQVSRLGRAVLVLVVGP